MAVEYTEIENQDPGDADVVMANFNAAKAVADVAVTQTGTETLTNKTLTDPVLNGDLSGTAVLDEDDMASDSATKVASQQSIKAYVDARTPAYIKDYQEGYDASMEATDTITLNHVSDAGLAREVFAWQYDSVWVPISYGDANYSFKCYETQTVLEKLDAGPTEVKLRVVIYGT